MAAATATAVHETAAYGVPAPLCRTPRLESRGVNLSRKCTKTACRQPAVATLTYVYSDRAAVLGPLATFAEPHTYDLCSEHATRLTAPRGWEVVRLSGDYPAPVSGGDDLSAIADVVREPRNRPAPATAPPPEAPPVHTLGEVRRGHLRVVQGSSDG